MSNEKVNPKKLSLTNHSSFFGDSKTAKHILIKDWSKSKLGTINQWPSILKNTLYTLLNSQLPTILFWGEQFTCFYNDAFLSILDNENKYISALGSEGPIFWEEKWPKIKSTLDTAFKTKTIQIDGQSIGMEKAILNLNPIYNELGKVSGTLIICHQTEKNSDHFLQEENGKSQLKRFKQIAENATDPFLLLRRDGSIAYLNALALDKWGYTKEEAKKLKLSDIDIIYNEDILSKAFKAAQKGEISRFETFHKKKDGSIYPVKMKMGRLELHSEQYLFALAKDTSSLKQAEKKLKSISEESDRKQRLYEAITGSTPDLIYVFDLDYKFIYANKALLAMWGRTWETAIGKGLLELGYEPWHAEMHIREIDQVIKTKKPIRGEVHFPHATQGKRLYDYIFVPVINEKGNVEAIAGTTRDITELKTVEESLKESEERFRNLAEAMPQLVWTTDKHGKADYFNNNWYSYTGSTAEENKGDGWASFLHPEDLDIVYNTWMKGVESGTPLSIEYRLRGKDGSYRWFLTRGLPQYDNKGDIAKWIGTCTDIEEQKQAMEQKDEFMSIASHELKTPITSLKASLQLASMLLKENDHDTIEDFLNKAENQVDKLSSLVNDLLDVTRIKSGNRSFHFTQFCIKEMIENCIHQQSYQTKNHTILTQIETNVGIVADKVRIEQVFTNILTNAIKYSPEGGEIHVNSTITKDNSLTISVRDNGIGISKEKQELIFNRFYRAEETSNQFQGLGLGLYISNEIIKEHGGKMWVDSIEGQGSTFFFSIPINLNNTKS